MSLHKSSFCASWPIPISNNYFVYMTCSNYIYLKIIVVLTDSKILGYVHTTEVLACKISAHFAGVFDVELYGIFWGILGD